jgi:hypothetical protein
MPRQGKGNEHVRKLGRTGAVGSKSYYVTLPVSLIRELGWRDNQRIAVRRMHGQPKLILEDWQEEE